MKRLSFDNNHSIEATSKHHHRHSLTEQINPTINGTETTVDLLDAHRPEPSVQSLIVGSTPRSNRSKKDMRSDFLANGVINSSTSLMCKTHFDASRTQSMSDVADNDEAANMNHYPISRINNVESAVKKIAKSTDFDDTQYARSTTPAFVAMSKEKNIQCNRTERKSSPYFGCPTIQLTSPLRRPPVLSGQSCEYEKLDRQSLPAPTLSVRLNISRHGTVSDPGTCSSSEEENSRGPGHESWNRMSSSSTSPLANTFSNPALQASSINTNEVIDSLGLFILPVRKTKNKNSTVKMGLQEMKNVTRTKNAAMVACATPKRDADADPLCSLLQTFVAPMEGMEIGDKNSFQTAESTVKSKKVPVSLDNESLPIANLESFAATENATVKHSINRQKQSVKCHQSIFENPKELATHIDNQKISSTQALTNCDISCKSLDTFHKGCSRDLSMHEDFYPEVKMASDVEGTDTAGLPLARQSPAHIASSTDTKETEHVTTNNGETIQQHADPDPDMDNILESPEVTIDPSEYLQNPGKADNDVSICRDMELGRKLDIQGVRQHGPSTLRPERPALPTGTPRANLVTSNLSNTLKQQSDQDSAIDKTIKALEVAIAPAEQLHNPLNGEAELSPCLDSDLSRKQEVHRGHQEMSLILQPLHSCRIDENSIREETIIGAAPDRHIEVSKKALKNRSNKPRSSHISCSRTIDQEHERLKPVPSDGPKAPTHVSIENRCRDNIEPDCFLEKQRETPVRRSLRNKVNIHPNSAHAAKMKEIIAKEILPTLVDEILRERKNGTRKRKQPDISDGSYKKSTKTGQNQDVHQNEIIGEASTHARRQLTVKYSNYKNVRLPPVSVQSQEEHENQPTTTEQRERKSSRKRTAPSFYFEESLVMPSSRPNKFFEIAVQKQFKWDQILQQVQRPEKEEEQDTHVAFSKLSRKASDRKKLRRKESNDFPIPPVNAKMVSSKLSIEESDQDFQHAESTKQSFFDEISFERSSNVSPNVIQTTPSHIEGGDKSHSTPFHIEGGDKSHPVLVREIGVLNRSNSFNNGQGEPAMAQLDEASKHSNSIGSIPAKEEFLPIKAVGNVTDNDCGDALRSTKVNHTVPKCTMSGRRPTRSVVRLSRAPADINDHSEPDRRVTRLCLKKTDLTSGSFVIENIRHHKLRREAAVGHSSLLPNSVDEESNPLENESRVTSKMSKSRSSSSESLVRPLFCANDSSLEKLAGSDLEICTVRSDTISSVQKVDSPFAKKHPVSSVPVMRRSRRRAATAASDVKQGDPVVSATSTSNISKVRSERCVTEKSFCEEQVDKTNATRRSSRLEGRNTLKANVSLEATQDDHTQLILASGTTLRQTLSSEKKKKTSHVVSFSRESTKKVFSLQKSKSKSSNTNTIFNDGWRIVGDPFPAKPVNTGGYLVSFSYLLDRYDRKVSRGICERVDFGSTIDTAKVAVDDKIRELEKREGETEVSHGVQSDIFDYKRGLKSFSVFEDQERLERSKEKEHDSAAERIRLYNRRNYKKTQEEIEAENLLRFPIQITGFHPNTHSRIKVCSGTCPLCHGDGEKTPTEKKPTQTLMPLYRRFDIDLAEESEDDDEDLGNITRKKSKRANIVCQKGKQSLMALKELQQTLEFVEEYYHDNATIWGIRIK